MQRQQNPISPFERILAVKGKDFIQKTYYKALEEATVVTKHIIIAPQQQYFVQQLGGSILPTPPAPIICKIKDQKSPYPHVKVRLDSEQSQKILVETFGRGQIDDFGGSQSSVPLDLHKVSILETYGWTDELVEAAKRGESDVAHRCHTKNCFEKQHCHFVSKHANISHEYCKVWIQVNGVNINICSHNPKCLYPGASCNLTL